MLAVVLLSLLMMKSTSALMRPLLQRTSRHCRMSTSVPTAIGEAALTRNADPNAVFVVTGASRGLGKEFVSQLLLRTKGKVVACCRDPGSTSLQPCERLKLLPLDLSSQDSIDAFPESLKANGLTRVDVLLNVAGILHDSKFPRAPERSLKDINREWLLKTLEVNFVGPFMIIKALEPMLSHPRESRSATASIGESITRAPSVIANVSARVGSIADNGLGGWHSYRTSKAALNMATKNTAIELKRSNVWAIALHPGTTDTDLSRPFQKNVRPEKLFTPEFSVKSMLTVVDGLDATHTGSFFAYDGKSIEW